MTILLILFAVLVGSLVTLFALAAVRSGDFKIVRETLITAPPSKVIAHLTAFRKWEAWSPWEGIDPKMQRVYSGPDSGEGAHYEWIGNDKVGTGTMEILRVDGESSVELALTFIKPWQAKNRVIFGLEVVGNGTRITWTMTGTQSFLLKVMSVLISMDKLVGKDFEKGLAKLKSVVEAEQG